MTRSRGPVTPGRIRLCDVDLDQPLRDLNGLDDYVALRALVRAHGVPLGIVDVPLTHGTCAASSVHAAVLSQLGATLRRYLEQLGRTPEDSRLERDPLWKVIGPAPAGGAADSPFVTVAVCTRDRPHDLEICLASVSRLEYARLDVLVVDNAPSDDVTEQLLRSTFPAVRYAREPRRGLNWARNRAVLEARGDIIAFTDDDVVVDARWVRGLASAFARAGDDVLAVTGLVVPFELETDAQVWFERYGGFTAGFEPRTLRGDARWGVRGAWHYAQMAQQFTGANMAFRRRAFDEVGLFDPALDVGTPTNGGGDLDMLYRILKEGFAVVYEPRAMVRHRHRRDYATLRHQIHGWGSGYSAFLTRSAIAWPEASWVLALLGARAVWQQVVRSTRASLRPPGFPPGLAWRELSGTFVGPLRYWRARNAAAAALRRFGAQAPEGAQ